MNKGFLASAACVAFCAAFAAPAYADEAAQPTADSVAPAVENGSAGSEIVVTGSARAQRRFDVSYAINSLNQEAVEKIAPVNLPT